MGWLACLCLGWVGMSRLACLCLGWAGVRGLDLGVFDPGWVWVVCRSLGWCVFDLGLVGVFDLGLVGWLVCYHLVTHLCFKMKRFSYFNNGHTSRMHAQTQSNFNKTASNFDVPTLHDATLTHFPFVES